MKESSIESRTRNENQAEKEAACGNTAAASFFVLRVPRSNSPAVLQRAGNSIRGHHDPVDNAP
ncbi:MAG: hypothetical protein QOJ51_4206 [Acidobacteriaceae bacterium]|jgi:hypothetical protein|nr:hypothetical protein [Acidobacteriaceae bacterium]MDX6457324.1 hypothetical protein [Acidobacteriaceae bacterium]MEA2261381.1 hypothetical protein [Acidobacteriaceae bacterium]